MNKNTLTWPEIQRALEHFQAEDRVIELRLHPPSYRRFRALLELAGAEMGQGLPPLFGLPVIEDQDVPEGQVRGIWKSGKMEVYTL